MQCPGDVGRLHYRRPGNLWNFWTVNYSCLIDLSDDVHHHVRCACMYVRTEYTHTYIYHNMYSFTWFYNILHASLSIFYIHILYVIHNKYRSSAPASAAGLGAKHCTPSQRCRWWHQLLGISVFFCGKSSGYFMGIYIYICIYVFIHMKLYTVCIYVLWNDYLMYLMFLWD